MKKYDNFFEKDNKKPLKFEEKDLARIYSQKELDVFLLKLKNYFNEVSGLTISNRKKIEFLRKEESRIEKFLTPNIKEIEFQGKIYGEDIVDHNDTFEKINKKNEELLKKKNEFNQLNLVELEYKKTLEFKIENEKENLNKLISNLDEVKEKTKSLILAEKRISTTCEPELKHSLKLNRFKKELEDENQRIKNLLVSQEGKLHKLNEIIESENTLLNEQREKVKGKNILLSIEMKDKKEGIFKCYEETDNLRKLKVNKENHYINITLGLNLIKNYLMSSLKNNDLDNILSGFNETSDYKIFKGIKESISRESTSTAKSKKGYQDSNEDYYVYKGAKISLSYLKDKINKTDMNYDDIYEFYTRILNKKNFNQNIITKFNNQQIKLEGQKESNNKKIQNMIAKNYKNVDLIIKSNTQLENLLKKYHNYSTQLFATPSKYYNFPELFNENKEFSSKCLYFMKEIKMFLEYIENITEILEKEKAFDEKSNKKLKMLLQKISNYFIYSEKINSDEEEYVNELFNFFEKHTKLKLDDNHNDILVPNLCSSRINDIAKLKAFYKYQKTYFFSINHEMDIKKYHTINSLDERLIDIIDLIITFLNDNLNSDKKFPNYQTINSEDDFLLTNYTNTNSKRTNLNSKYRNIDSGRLDDNSSYTEINKERLFVKKISRNTKLFNQNIRDFINRHYNPYLESKKFQITLNENSTAYRHLSLKAHKDLKSIDKKQEESNKISDQMFMYNNPKINVESLSKTTYNSFVRQIITNQVEKTKPNSQLTFNISKKKFNYKK